MEEDKTSYAQFENGTLRSIERPDWFGKIIAPSFDNSCCGQECLLDAGYGLVQEIDDQDVSGDELRIYRSYEETASASYIVEIWERSTLIAYIFVKDVVTYLDFKAKYVAPWVAVLTAAANFAKPSPFALRSKAA